MDEIDTAYLFGIFKGAWRVFWKHGSIWLVGILAALLGYNEYASRFDFADYFKNYALDAIRVSLTYPYTYPYGGSTDLQQVVELVEQYVGEVTAFFEAMPQGQTLVVLAVTMLVLLSAAFAAAIALLRRGGRGVMVIMAYDAHVKGEISLRAGLGVVRGRLWSLAGIGLIVWIPSLFITLLSAGPFLLMAYFGILMGGASLDSLMVLLTGASSFNMTNCCCIGFFVSIALSLVEVLDRYAIRACLLEDRDTIQSLKLAWVVMRFNLKYTLLMWGTLILAKTGYGLVVTIGMLVIGGVTLLLMEPEYEKWALLFVGLMIPYVLLTKVVIGGAMTGFNSTLWTLGFRDFRERMALTGR